MHLYLQQLHGLAVLFLSTQLSHLDENWLWVSGVLRLQICWQFSALISLSNRTIVTNTVNYSIRRMIKKLLFNFMCMKQILRKLADWPCHPYNLAQCLMLNFSSIRPIVPEKLPFKLLNPVCNLPTAALMSSFIKIEPSLLFKHSLLYSYSLNVCIQEFYLFFVLTCVSAVCVPGLYTLTAMLCWTRWLAAGSWTVCVPHPLRSSA